MNIKFKGKKIDSGEWVYGYLFRSTSDLHVTKIKLGFYIQVIDMKTFYHNSFEVNPNSISQFTGLTDVDNIDIYSGDILQEINPRGNKYRIFNVGGGFVINSFQDELQKLYSGWEALADQQTSGFITSQCRIIGNITDHPHLLTK